MLKESICNGEDMCSMPGSGGFPGEGNGNQIQYSWLGNPIDRGAWRATVCGVAKESTWLSDWTTTKITLNCLSGLTAPKSYRPSDLLFHKDLSDSSLSFETHARSSFMSTSSFMSPFSHAIPQPQNPQSFYFPQLKIISFEDATQSTNKIVFLLFSGAVQFV